MLVAEASLREDEIQNLSDTIGDLTKTAVGLNLQFHLRVELGPVSQVPDETMARINELLSQELLSSPGMVSQYTNFTGAIRKAEIACQESGEAVSDHFLHMQEMTPGGKGATRRYPTVHLSRFACYLLVENADPEGRPIVALGQTYFAIQTRRQELAYALTLSVLPEDQKRLIYRREMAVLNHQLAEAAKLSGVIKPEHFAIFTDRGYQGLYKGETENMIHARKGLQEGEHILDFMGSDELIANAFRASLARQRLERDKTRDREQANQIHYQAGRKVRQTIEEFGGTVPEQLPTPKKSFGQLEREEQQRIEQSKQPPLFPEDAEEDNESS